MTSTTNSNLHNYNHELVACIDDLRRKREEVHRQIIKEEEDRAKVQKEIALLQERLQKLNDSITRKIQARNEYDKTILETEAAYTKVRPYEGTFNFIGPKFPRWGLSICGVFHFVAKHYQFALDRALRYKL